MTTKSKNWVERFEKVFDRSLFTNCVGGYETIDIRPNIKQFISNLLSTQRQELKKKIKKMKVNFPKYDDLPIDPTEIERYEWYYNKAIDDVLRLL